MDEALTLGGKIKSKLKEGIFLTFVELIILSWMAPITVFFLLAANEFQSKDIIYLIYVTLIAIISFFIFRTKIGEIFKASVAGELLGSTREKPPYFSGEMKAG